LRHDFFAVEFYEAIVLGCLGNDAGIGSSGNVKYDFRVDVIDYLLGKRG
jgi:hypothetical protein